MEAMRDEPLVVSCMSDRVRVSMDALIPCLLLTRLLELESLWWNSKRFRRIVSQARLCICYY